MKVTKLQKVLAALTALIVCVALMAGCGGEKKEAATKDKVTLYGRDGDRHFPDLHQMTVYEKNGAYYIYINHQYYQMQNCRWKDFNYYIHYKHMRYIKYKH